ncbi:type II toxin-antitoxin system RelE/ParE family toxin [Candidatus Woesearchaeota archaeon]|nr:type II toxin-antitoxin system RelE/ParE family toxin [Candidatus Woesearchaeota archaeon]
MYKILFTQTAEKQFKKLKKEIQIRIGNALRRIQLRPYSYVKRLVGVPYFCLRIGEYRIILDIKENNLIIYVISLGHRRNIYK